MFHCSRLIFALTTFWLTAILHINEISERLEGLYDDLIRLGRVPLAMKEEQLLAYWGSGE